MATPAINVLSLCTGAGGLDLGVRMALPTSRTVCYVEIEAYAAAVLATRMEEKAMDDAPLWSDLRTFDGSAWRGKVSLVVGGYPCQPFSVAGRQRGADDPRHLWPSVERIVREVRPTAVFFENVSNHLSLGGYEVVRSLQALGYEVAATLVEAQEVGAPHKRQRLFILGVVHASLPRTARFDAQCGDGGQTAAGTVGSGHRNVAHCHGQCGDRCRHAGARGGRESTDGSLALADAGCRCLAGRGDAGNVGSSTCTDEGEGLQWQRVRDAAGNGRDDLADTQHSRREFGGTADDNDGHHARWLDVDGRDTGLPAFPPGRSDLDAWQAILDYDASVEPSVCGVVDGLETRVDRLRLCGNGVVPQQAAFAFRELWAALMESNQ